MEGFSNMNNFDSYHRWLNDTRKRQIAHIKTNAYFSLLNQVIGFIIIILSSITASSIFTGLTTTNPIAYYVGVSFGILVTITAALQTSLKLPEKAEKHHDSSVKYGDVRREIEKYVADFSNGILTLDDLSQKMEKIRDKMVEIDKKRPYIPQRLWKKASNQVKKDNNYTIQFVSPP